MRVAWGAKVSKDFLARALWMCDDLSIGEYPADGLNKFMACSAFETGETFSPSKKNPVSTATGLIQFMEYTAKKLGTTTAELAAMTAEDQIYWCWKYFNQFTKSKKTGEGGNLRLISAEDIYMSILWPKGIGKPLDWNLFEEDGETARAFKVNRGLDADKDGDVSKAEASVAIMAKFAKGLKEPYVWEGVL